MSTIDDAKATLKTAILEILSFYGGQEISITNTGKIVDNIIEVIQLDDINWALKMLVENSDKE